MLDLGQFGINSSEFHFEMQYGLFQKFRNETKGY